MTDPKRAAPGRGPERSARDSWIQCGFLAAARAADAPQSGEREVAGSHVGPYRLERLLGRGGQATVYLATDERFGRQVALKILASPDPVSPERRLRFRREAEVASRLDHPGICKVYDAGVDDDRAYIAMQYVDGETLAQRIAASRAGGAIQQGQPADDPATPTSPSSIERARVRATLELVEKIAHALHAAHEAGVLHRDLKPANIMVTRDGDPVITDFGLARAEEPGGPTLTLTGELLGTPAYMAPEQLSGELSGSSGRRGSSGSAPADRRTDVWSLGATLFESVTRTRPFDAPTREALYQAILTRDPPDLRRLCRSASPDLRAVVETALEKDRDRRYATAADLADDLAAVIAGRPTRARPLSRMGRAMRWSRREPAKAALVLVVAVALPILGGLGGYLLSQQQAIEVGGQELRSRAVERWLERGFLELLDGDRVAAAASFEAALGEDPDAGLAVAGLVLRHFALFEYQEADPRGALETLRRLGSGPRADPWLEAAVLRQVGRAGEAEEVERTARSAGYAPSPVRHFLDGVLQLPRALRGNRNAAESAFACLTKADLGSPPRLLFQCLRAQVAGQLRPEAEVRWYVEALLDNWPGDSMAWLHAGFALDRFDRDESMAAYRTAIELEDGRDYRALSALGAAIDVAERERWVNAGLPMRPEKLLEAEAMQRAAIDIHEGYDRAWLRLGVVQLWRSMFAGDAERADLLDAAVASVRRAAQISPRNPSYPAELTRVLLAAGHFEEAARQGEKAVAMDPEFTFAYSQLARAYMALEQLPEAESAVLEALNLQPGNSDFLHQLGEIYSWQGRPAEAIATLQKVLEQESDRVRPYVRKLLVDVLLRCDRVDEARAVLERWMELSPDSPEAGALLDRVRAR